MQLTQDLKDIIQQTKLTIRGLEKNPEKIFKEWSEEEIKESMLKRIEEKRDRVDEIKRRHNKENLSSS